jgi:hypothetical protein
MNEGENTDGSGPFTTAERVNHPTGDVRQDQGSDRGEAEVVTAPDAYDGLR